MNTIEHNLIPSQLKTLLETGLEICLNATIFQKEKEKINVYIRENEMKYVIGSLSNHVIKQINGPINTEIDNFLREYLGIPSLEFTEIINNSKWVTVEFGDHVNHHTCYKKWENHSEINSDNKHGSYYEPLSYFAISFEPEFDKLGYKHNFNYIYKYMSDYCNEFPNVKII